MSELWIYATCPVCHWEGIHYDMDTLVDVIKSGMRDRCPTCGIDTVVNAMQVWRKPNNE